MLLPEKTERSFAVVEWLNEPLAPFWGNWLVEGFNGTVAPLWSNWLVMAMFSSMLNAIVNILDVYFNFGKVYEDEYDGATISALFQGIVWVVVPLTGVQFPQNSYVACWAFLSGVLFVCSSFFYFRAMNRHGDAVSIETLWSFSMIVVPMLSYFLVGEKLTFRYYVGIGIAFIGVNIPALSEGLRGRGFFRLFKPMSMAVVLLALCLILENEVYQRTSFISGYLLFSLGSVVTGIFFSILRKVRRRRGYRSLGTLCRKHFRIFVLAELLAVAAVTCNNRAVDMSISASFVAVIDCTQPIFIMVFCYLITTFFSSILQRGEGMCEFQVEGALLKLVAAFIMSIGVAFINTNFDLMVFLKAIRLALN